MKIFQWKWIFTGSKTCCTIWRPFWFAIAAILNPKWSPRYKNPPIWAKFGFQVDYDVTNWLVSIVWEPCYDPSDHIISCFICFWYLSAYLFYNCFFFPCSFFGKEDALSVPSIFFFIIYFDYICIYSLKAMEVYMFF